MKNTNIQFLFILITILVVSCTEKIDIKIEDQNTQRLVVFGSISNDTTGHMISLTKTGNYFLNQQASKVSNAIVDVSDGDSIFRFTEIIAGSGEYFSAPDVFGIPGKTYTLNITLAEPVNGNINYSGSCTMASINTVDSIGLKYWDNIGEQGFYEVKIYVLDPPQVNYYTFNTYLNSVLLTDTITEVFITDDRLYNGNYTNGIGVQFFDQERPDQKFKPGDTVILKTSSITREYYQFLLGVQIEASPKVPLFSGPPANVKGNINNDAIGFFAAYSNAYAKTIVQIVQE